MDNRTKDRIRGVIFGNAIGDALGRGTEFLSKREVQIIYPNGIRKYEDIDMNSRFRRTWEQGEWTDDTDQMLCIMDSIIENKAVVPHDIAKRFLKWAVEDGRGMGGTTRRVFGHPLFVTDPHEAAEAIWLNSGKTLAPNGGVMRTSILGVWDHYDVHKVIQNTEIVCKITHADPRCVASCVAVTLAISQMVNGVDDPVMASSTAAFMASQYDEGIHRVVELAEKGSIYDLMLDDEDSIGYTYKTAHAGFWEFIQAENFHDGIIEIIHEGGDADTNAAVAGAMLGARFGFSTIPIGWVTGLVNAKELSKRTDAIVALLENR